VFRKTTCTAVAISQNTQIRTDKLNAWSLKRGTWNLESVGVGSGEFIVHVRLIAIRTVNLLFAGNPFFNPDVTVPANEPATFTGASTPIILDKAAKAWCAR
jgi:hypothetical protein